MEVITHPQTQGAEQRTEEGDAGRVDGAQFRKVLLVVVFTQLVSFLKDLPLTTCELLPKNEIKVKTNYFCSFLLQ